MRIMIIIDGVTFILDSNVTHHCTKCGKCCTLIPLTDKDVECIESLGYTDFYFTDEYGVRRMYGMYPEPCMFFTDNGGCSIYDHRPAICRIFPFVITFSDLGNVWCYSHKCPGLIKNNDNELVDVGVLKELIPYIYDYTAYMESLIKK